MRDVAHELWERRYWIDEATLTGWLDEELAERRSEDDPDALLRLYAAVHQTGWTSLLAHPLLRNVERAKAMRQVPPGADREQTVMVAVATATLLPYIQAVAAAAGGRAYDAARARLRSLLGSREARDVRWIAVHEDETGVSLVVPPNLPVAALEALATADLEGLAVPDPNGRSTVIAWDVRTHEWIRRVR